MLTQPETVANDPASRGKPAGQWLFIDDAARYIVCPTHTRFDAIAWFTYDCESIDPETGMYAVIRQEATFAAAIAGLDDSSPAQQPSTAAQPIPAQPSTSAAPARRQRQHSPATGVHATAADYFKDSAIRRIGRAGLTIAQAMLLSDDELIRFPSIGRKTLRWIRAFVVVE